VPELKMPKKGEGLAMLQELNATHAEPEENLTESNVTTLQPSKEVTLQSKNVTTNARDNEADNERTNAAGFESSNVTAVSVREAPYKPATKVPRKGGQVRSKTPLTDSNKEVGRPPAVRNAEAVDERTARFGRAMQLADDDEIAVVTVRTSARLNEYMDRYVERVNRVNPKRKYRKQDAVMEAFAAFFADHPMPPAPVEEDEL